MELSKRQKLLKSLAQEGGKIVYLVMDGLGDLATGKYSETPLEKAKTPNLDNLVAAGACGLCHPVDYGITPGSGPGHLGLFGFNPVDVVIGRGILEALGAGFLLKKGDIASRINFATINKDGVITDRRAGRISTEECIRLVEKLSSIKVEGVEILVKAVKEHRAMVVFRGEGLGGSIIDTDPQVTGKKPLPAVSTDETDKASIHTAGLVNKFIGKASEVLSDEPKANAILMRGFDAYHPLPTFMETYKMRSAAIAVYPMYRGLASLTGMELLEIAGETVSAEIDTLQKHYEDYDFFFIHIKKTDSYGEDGNFDAKVHVIEEVDTVIPRIAALKPAVILVTADHSTPCIMESHSFHPVPTLINGKLVRVDDQKVFTEKACEHGGMGQMPSEMLIGLAMAHAGRLLKFGA
ncbi:MAG: 2,3-bisphosphoglycerate-independent phosphoglycerate mutase [Candidatus Coatesbacteria bacterium]|nr:2,3-bisphosphoglycerate-independent phosphoglycerate mutase [Candidatus Coatesbacteria bacterium]